MAENNEEIKDVTIELEYDLQPLDEVQQKCISQLQYARRQYQKGKKSESFVAAKYMINLFGSLAYYLEELKKKQDV